MILGELVRAGILKSTRGKGGGFCLARPPEEIRLFEIVQHFEPAPSAPRACPFGNQACGDDSPCLAHNDWKKVTQAKQQFFEWKTLYDVSTEKGTVSKRKKKRKER
jgi:Rrf2 family protein